MKSGNKTLFLGLGGTLWLLAVFAMYSYTHKPFSPSQITLILRELWQVLVALGILFLAGGIGYRAFPAPKDWSRLAAMAVQTALGFGILALLIFLLGVTIGFSVQIFFALFFLIALFFVKSVFLWGKQAREFSSIWAQSDSFEKGLAFGVFFIIFVTFLKSLAPPLAFDTLVYHLTLPKMYLLAGRITYIPELIFWGMPQLQEMGMTFAMSLAGAESAVLFSWTFGMLTLVGLLGYLSERFSTRVAWVAVVSLLAGRAFSDSLAWGYVEWAVMLYGLSIFIVLSAWVEKRSRQLLVIAALLVGFAIGTKYTAGILLAGALFVIFYANKKNGLAFIAKDLLLFMGIILVVVSPWLIKNWLATGNPVYPLLFPAGEMDVYRLHLYQGDLPWGDWRDLIFLPWRTTIWGIDGAVGYSAEIGSLLLAFSVFAWFGWRERIAGEKDALRTAFLFVAIGFLLWGIAGRTSRLLIQSRLYFAFFPVWAILAGVGFEKFASLRGSGVRFERIGSTFLLLAFGFNLFQTFTDVAYLAPTRVLLGVQSASSYREQALGRYDRAMSAIAELPSDGQIVMLWETRGFACVPKCEPDEVIDRWYADLRTYGSADALLDEWRDAGYTHLLVNQRGVDFIRENDPAYTANDWSVLDVALGQLVLLSDFDGEYQIFSLGN